MEDGTAFSSEVGGGCCGCAAKEEYVPTPQITSCVRLWLCERHVNVAAISVLLFLTGLFMM